MRRVMREKGITLVALIVTIIVILILAGVTLRLAIGEDDGIITETNYAKDETEKAQIKEKLDLALTTWQMRKSRGAYTNGSTSEEDGLIELLNSSFGTRDVDYSLVESNNIYVFTYNGIEITFNSEGESQVTPTQTTNTELWVCQGSGTWVCEEKSGTTPSAIFTNVSDFSSYQTASTTPTFEDGISNTKNYLKIEKSKTMKFNMQNKTNGKVIFYLTSNASAFTWSALNQSIVAKDSSTGSIVEVPLADGEVNEIATPSSSEKELRLFAIKFVYNTEE